MLFFQGAWSNTHAPCRFIVLFLPPAWVPSSLTFDPQNGTVGPSNEGQLHSHIPILFRTSRAKKHRPSVSTSCVRQCRCVPSHPHVHRYMFPHRMPTKTLPNSHVHVKRPHLHHARIYCAKHSQTRLNPLTPGLEAIYLVHFTRNWQPVTPDLRPPSTTLHFPAVLIRENGMLAPRSLMHGILRFKCGVAVKVQKLMCGRFERTF